MLLIDQVGLFCAINIQHVNNFLMVHINILHICCVLCAFFSGVSKTRLNCVNGWPKAEKINKIARMHTLNSSFHSDSWLTASRKQQQRKNECILCVSTKMCENISKTVISLKFICVKLHPNEAEPNWIQMMNK